MKKKLIILWLVALVHGCGSEPDINVNPEKYNVLYIGHSFGRPFAEAMEDFSEAAGISDHAQHIVFSGGASGTPGALWANAAHRTEILAYLDTGEIDVLIMICCSVDFIESEGAQDAAIWEFTAYAYEKNPDIRIGLALSWQDYPEDYSDVATHRMGTDVVYPYWQDLGNNLSMSFGGLDVFTIYHGAAIYALRELYEADSLDDVQQMTGPRASSLFTDTKGHAAHITKDTGALLWLYAIHGVDPLSMPYFEAYDTDIRDIAASVLNDLDY